MTWPEAPELAARAGPVNHIHPDAPPFHIAHGDADRFVPAAQSGQFADALRRAGVPVEHTSDARRRPSLGRCPVPEAIVDAPLDFASRHTTRR